MSELGSLKKDLTSVCKQPGEFDYLKNLMKTGSRREVEDFLKVISSPRYISERILKHYDSNTLQEETIIMNYKQNDERDRVRLAWTLLYFWGYIDEIKYQETASKSDIITLILSGIGSEDAQLTILDLLK